MVDNTDSAGLLVSACRQAHDPKSGQHKRGPQCGHHPCHRASMLTSYISGKIMSSSSSFSAAAAAVLTSGHHPCHRTSLLASYISGQVPSSFATLALLFLPTVSFGCLLLLPFILLLLLLPLLLLLSSHFAMGWMPPC